MNKIKYVKTKKCFGGLRQMILHLQQMEYKTGSSYEEMQAFYKQYLLIYKRFKEQFTFQFWDTDTNILFKLFDTMAPSQTHLIKKTIAFFRYHRAYSMFGVEFPETIELDIDRDYLFDELKNSKERYNLLALYLSLPSDTHNEHVNMLIFDKEKKQVFRIEPNYGFPGNYDTIVNNKSKEWLNGTGYKYIGFFESSCKALYHPGFCLWVSLVKYIYGKTLTNEILKKVIVDFFKKEYNSFCKDEPPLKII